MRGGRRTLPVLAEISGPAPGESRAWSLRRADFEALAKPLGKLGERRLGPHRRCRGAGRLALALAGAAAASGRRTALLGGDLAHPRLAGDLGLAPVPGLHEYLRWEATAPQILQPLVLAGPASAAATQDSLVCIVAGRPSPDPGALVALDSFRHASAKLRGAYELTVADRAVAGCRGRGAGGRRRRGVDAVIAATSSQGLSGPAGRQLRSGLRRLSVPTLGVIAVAGASAG